MGRVCLSIVVLFTFICSVLPAHADEAAILETLKAMKVQMADMQEKIVSLENKVSRQDAVITQSDALKDAYEERIKDLEDQLAAQPSVSDQTVTTTSKSANWTPDIGVVADTVYTHTSSREDKEGNNRLSVREVELIFGSDIDPFSRLDVVASFSDEEDPSLEEAYMTRFGLPLNSTARLGKFKPKVGKVLQIHRDSLDTVDNPLVIQRYFGVEGLNKSGADVTVPLNLPWSATHEATIGVIEGGNGEDGTAFGDAKRTPTLYSRLRNYLDVTDVTGLEFGVSHMIGSGRDEPGFDAQILAADLTLTQALGDQRQLKWQNEIFNLNRRKTVDADGNLWGGYSLVDYRFHPRASTGLRYDHVDLVDNPSDNIHGHDEGKSVYLTFNQSEFARWRLQYNHREMASGRDDHSVYLQGTFSIGDHKHKLQ